MRQAVEASWTMRRLFTAVSAKRRQDRRQVLKIDIPVEIDVGRRVRMRHSELRQQRGKILKIDAAIAACQIGVVAAELRTTDSCQIKPLTGFRIDLKQY